MTEATVIMSELDGSTYRGPHPIRLPSVSDDACREREGVCSGTNLIQGSQRLDQLETLPIHHPRRQTAPGELLVNR